MIPRFRDSGREENVIKFDNSTKACGYYRLSKEDGDKTESDSIKNQKSFVRDFAHKNKITLLDEYTDDGYTGTNFVRPSFTRLWKDIQDEKINCIIVKDLSRLGRNYIEMGKYLTQWFPQFGVRVIAINDNYDSNDEGSTTNQIIVPFKNLINDAYCRDMSVKVRSQLDLKRKNGKFIGSFPLYGYEKDADDHNKLVIDETAGKVVELIFNMKLDGYSTLRIVQKLTELQIPTPLEYKRICGYNFNSGFRSSLNAKWSVTSVNRILRNEMYTGTMVQGKRRKINYKVKKVVDVCSQDWIRVENTHEAIVPKELFDVVQKLMEKDTRVSPGEKNVYPLSGLVFCGDCGQNMIRRMSSKNGKKYHYYYCTTYKYTKECKAHNISEQMLFEAVLNTIQNTLSFLSEATELIKTLNYKPKDVIGVKLIDKQLESQNREINRYSDLKVKLYMDMTDGLITRDEFMELNKTFSEKIDRLTASVRENEKQKEKKLSLDVREIPWIQDFLQYQNITKLDRRVAVALIDKIVVYENKQIEVFFHHREEIEDILSIAGNIKEGSA